MIEARVKQGKIEASEAKKQIPKRQEGETHMVTYQGKAYNPFYSPQQNYGYQSYNQYGGNAMCKEIISQTPNLWQDSLRCRHQHMWWLLSQWDNQVIMLKIQKGYDFNESSPSVTQFPWPTQSCISN